MNNKTLNLRDRFSLYQFSLRYYFYTAYIHPKLNRYRIGWFILIIAVFYAPIPICVFVWIVVRFLAGDPMPFGVYLAFIIYWIIRDFVLFNPQRLSFSLRFKDSAWWKNTSITPTEIKNDPEHGLYGEYMSTMAAEQFLKINNCYGKVFNNVIVPKKNDSFTEIDVLLVSEYGIYVIEAKTRRGTFTGNLAEKTWTQNTGNQVYEMQNPVWQNMQHCSFLNDYIYNLLPDGELKNNGISTLFINTVLFDAFGTVLNINGDLDSMPFFVGVSYGKNGFSNNKIEHSIEPALSKKEIDIIGNIVKDISNKPADERTLLISKRLISDELGETYVNYEYYIALIHNKELPEEYMLAFGRNDGYYNMFQDNMGLFRCFPEDEKNMVAKGKGYRDIRQVKQEAAMFDQSLSDKSTFDALFNLPSTSQLYEEVISAYARAGENSESGGMQQPLPPTGQKDVKTNEDFKCPKCGADVKAGANFCSKCGTKLS